MWPAEVYDFRDEFFGVTFDVLAIICDMQTVAEKRSFDISLIDFCWKDLTNSQLRNLTTKQ